jgi:uncharacterized protein YcbK (DUF882 family)
MQKLITILIGCSLTFAAGAWAAKPDANKGAAKKPKNAQKQQAAPKQQQHKAPKAQVHSERGNKPVTHNAAPKISKKQAQQRPEVSNAAPPVKANKMQKDQLKTSKQEQKLQTRNQQQLQTGNQQARKTRLSKESVAKIQAQHRNFRARPNTAIAGVQFNQNYQIQNAQNWNGNRYNVFRSYRPQWHDQGWWKSHHRRLSLIGGGWYFWDGGYWYPAWGYDQAASYYPYDGPIYSGPSARPADQVVADVQAALQEQGYYRGEVDGLLGPLTRQALAEFQQANGLYATQTIDQPTLESLGLAG